MTSHQQVTAEYGAVQCALQGAAAHYMVLQVPSVSLDTNRQVTSYKQLNAPLPRSIFTEEMLHHLEDKTEKLGPLEKQTMRRGWP